MHFAAVARLHDERDLGAGLLAHEVLVHRRGQQHRWDRGELGGGVPVGEHEDAHAILDRLRDAAADLHEARFETATTFAHPVQAAHAYCPKARQVAVLVDGENLGELVVVDDRLRQDDLAAACRPRLQQVALRSDGGGDTGDQLLANRVQRRVGHLSEGLDEVVVEQPGALAQHGHGSVGAHGADRLRAGERHRGNEDLQLLFGVAKDLLAPLHRVVRVDDVFAWRQRLQVHEPGLQPLAVRRRGGELLLDLVILDDPASCGVDEEHPSRLQSALGDDIGGVDVEHTGLAGQHHQSILGAPPSAWAQPVAVEHCADHRPVGEGDARRSVPGLHQTGVEAVEVAPLRVHGLVVFPRLRNHHEHRVGEAAPAEVQELEHLVEVRRV